MTGNFTDLAQFGWSRWFTQQASQYSSSTFARVAAVDRQQLLLVDATGTYRAKLSGSYLYQSEGRDLPCVGDWVSVERQPGDDFAMVQGLLQRKTALRRRAVGVTGEEQLIAANIDCVFIVQSCHFDFNPKRLQRYVVMVADGGAEARVVLTKTDLVSAETLAEQLAELDRLGLAASPQTVSSVTGEGIAGLESSLLGGQTYCFVGSSGVGKSTLVNRLLGRARLDTAAVSASGEGRHTTVRRELVMLDSGAMVIDNPGMREFGIVAAEESIDAGFADIGRLAAACRYRDCGHNGEPGCAIAQALTSGELSREQWDNYLKLRNEAQFYSMTQAERRRKERDFGKLIKNVKKNLRR